MEPVRNHRNPTVVEAARLHRAKHRKESGTTLLEGPHLLNEAIAAGALILDVFALESDEKTAEITARSGLSVTPVTDRALARLAGTDGPRGPVAVVAIPRSNVIGNHHAVVSWGVSDPGNVGSMIRVAAAFGWDFAYSAGTSDPWSPKVLRTAAGNQFRVAMTEISTVDELRSFEYNPLASVVSGGDSPQSLQPGHWALLIGDEGSGLPADIVEACDASITLSMSGEAESLNAAVATGIIVYAISQTAGQSLRSV